MESETNFEASFPKKKWKHSTKQGTLKENEYRITLINMYELECGALHMEDTK